MTEENGSCNGLILDIVRTMFLPEKKPVTVEVIMTEAKRCSIFEDEEIMLWLKNLEREDLIVKCRPDAYKPTDLDALERELGLTDWGLHQFRKIS